jgi:membrane fusion protein, multidrug efflux system
MKKTWRWIVAVVILLIVFGLSFGWDVIKSYMTKQYFSHYQVPAIAVSTTLAKQEIWHPSLSAVGTLAAVDGVNVNAKVSGQVVDIYFKSGQFVAKGQPLVKLSCSSAEQAVISNEAKLKLAKLQYQRQQRLYRSKSIAKSVLDEAKANYVSAQAALNSAQIDLNNKLIKAPFSGKLGISNVDLGQYIHPGDGLVSLQVFNPLYVNFTLPEQNTKDVKLEQSVTLDIDAYPKRSFQGVITAIGAKVDTSTRSFKLQATLPNPHNIVYPGSFAEVKINLPDKKNITTIPQTAISYSLYGDSVYVVKTKEGKGDQKPTLIVQQTFVTLGARKGSDVEVIKGINVGDQVVTSGQLKLRSGAAVKINNTVKMD